MIKACLFDLGNVLLFFSHEKMMAQMADVMGVSAAEVRTVLERDRLQWRYEAGEVSSAELAHALRQITKRPFEDAALLLAASDIFVPNTDMLPILAALRRLDLKLVIVSNTNAAHMDFARPRYELFNYFDATIFSHEIKAVKPEPRFYAAALAAAGCERGECVFVDDLPVNIEGAARFGFKARLFTDATRLKQDLKDLGIRLGS